MCLLGLNALVVTKSCCHLITVRLCKISVVSKQFPVSVSQKLPPRLAPIIALAGSPGEEAKVWLLFPLSVLAVVLLRVCVSGLWLNVVCSVLCRAASLASFISTDFYH